MYPTEDEILAEMVKQIGEMGLTRDEVRGMLIRHSPSKTRASQMLAKAAALYLAQTRETSNG